MDMASKTVNRLDDKTEMYQLTPKQKAVVNALAANPNEGPKQIATIASESLEGDTVSRSYVHPIKTKYADLVEQQREIKDNERTEGETKTTGDPFESLDANEETTGWQLIQDRPKKAEGKAETDSSETFQLSITESDMQMLLDDGVPEKFRQKVVQELFKRATS